MANTSTFRVQLVKSGIGYDKTQKDTLRGLGLLKRERIVTLADTPAARGMVYKVRHLVRVLDAKEAAGKSSPWKGAIVVPGPRDQAKATKESKSGKGKKAAKSAAKKTKKK